MAATWRSHRVPHYAYLSSVDNILHQISDQKQRPPGFPELNSPHYSINKTPGVLTKALYPPLPCPDNLLIGAHLNHLPGL